LTPKNKRFEKDPFEADKKTVYHEDNRLFTSLQGACVAEIDLSKQPTSSGVYMMKSPDGQILYVGKAKNLRARLRSYLQSGKESRPQVKFLMQRASEVETIVTDTEKEALILENTLIKKHRPRYNIHLRDDKTFVSLRIDLQEDFPMLQMVRKVRNDGARYFGPFASASALRKTLKEIYRIFLLRHYPVAQCKQRGRPCLFHQIGQCSAPCHGLISKEDYQKLVRGVIAFMEGRKKAVVKLLEDRMQRASKLLQYEQAGLLRDQIRAIEATIEKQKTVRYQSLDQDILGLSRRGGEVEFAMLFYRQGRLNARFHINVNWQLDEDDLLMDFLLRFYDREVIVPDEVILPFAFEGMDSFADWLSERHRRKISVLVPQRGLRRSLVELAHRNAEEAQRERTRKEEASLHVLADIQKKLHLKRLPKRMECFDVSTMHGQSTVASMAVVIDGEPARDEYRHYRIRLTHGMDDYGALREVLQRRLRRGMDESALPDFILVDGGKGQLGVVATAVNDLGLSETIDLAGIAKSRVKTNARSQQVERSRERFFLPGRKNPVLLRDGSAALFLMERLRDEAHRFAISYHRKLRHKAQVKSTLSEIPGVGPKRQRALLRSFGSLKKIKEANIDQLSSLADIPKPLAARIYAFYHPGDGL
jgi:excinuclease ABC subunit C